MSNNRIEAGVDCEMTLGGMGDGCEYWVAL